MLIIGLTVASACGSARKPTPASPPAAAASVVPAKALAEVQSRATALEQHLAAREDEVAALQTEVKRLREREEASRSALTTLKSMLQARAARPTVSYTPRLDLSTLRRTGEAEAEAGAEPGMQAGETASVPSPEHKEVDTNRTQVAEAELAQERDKRRALEEELERLRRETSTGPYSDGVSDQLRAARRKIEGLEAALTSAHKARDELAEKYAALKQKMESTSQQSNSALNTQLRALEEQHREALANVEQELAASRLREKELRDTLASVEQGQATGSLAAVADLRAENEALRARLDEEHQRNIVMAGKLKMASRIAEMIFKARVGQAKLAQ